MWELGLAIVLWSKIILGGVLVTGMLAIAGIILYSEYKYQKLRAKREKENGNV